MTKKKKEIPTKIHERKRGNIEVEYFQSGKNYTFIVYAYNGTGVIDQQPSKPYTSLTDCLHSGIIQFYSMQEIHGS